MAAAVSVHNAGGGVVEIVLCRPPVNALAVGDLRDLTAAVHAAGADPEARCVVLRAGETARGFNAGGDLKEMQRLPGHQGILGQCRESLAACEALRRCEIPIVAAVHGYCLGLGLELVGCCDAVMAAEGTQFQFTEVDNGTVGGAAQGLRLLPPMQLRRAMLTGAAVSAEELQHHGGCSVVPRTELRSRALELAAAIAAKSPAVLRSMKTALDAVEGFDPAAAMRTEQGLIYALNMEGVGGASRGAFLNGQRRGLQYTADRGTEWDYDVTVVGKGPVGGLCALLLGRMGLRVLVLERSDGQESRPRATGVDDEALRIFQQVDLSAEIAADSILGPELQIVSDYTAGEAPELLFGKCSPAGVGSPGRWPPWRPHLPLGRCGYPMHPRLFYQPRLEACMQRELLRMPNVTVRLCRRFIDAAEELGGVTVRHCQSSGAWERAPGGEVRWAARDGAGSETTTRTRYLIGCDGASSAVRRALPTAMRQLGPDSRWIAVDLMLLRDDLFGDRLPHYCQDTCSGGRVVVYVVCGWILDNPRRGRHLRFDLQILDSDRDEDLESPEFVARCLRPWLREGEYVLHRHTLYTIHSLVAERWRSDRGHIFVCGDAAHTMLMHLGQGLCQGLKDVWNLCWKLEAVARGRAEDGLLDSYEAERKPLATAVVRASSQRNAVLCDFRDAERGGREALRSAARRHAAALRDGGFRLMHTRLPMLQPPAPNHRLAALAGLQLPQLRVISPNECRGDGVLLDTVLGPGPVLLSVSFDGVPPQLSTGQVAALQRAGARLARVAVPPELAGVDGTNGAVAQNWGPRLRAGGIDLVGGAALVAAAPAVLAVRPDRFVCCAMPAAEVDAAAAALVEAVTGRRSSTSKL
eukprot:TRINITY_DN15105_c0_g1_i3.p1 TRINITY_DN15105_c0_g1~~TRINITY_DN15105_c0_g1_i3.p1  ORF type:complete len:866 (+),score=177.88 TRINITY_DN15105_c0_g1_i3:79-2676(+)